MQWSRGGAGQGSASILRIVHNRSRCAARKKWQHTCRIDMKDASNPKNMKHTKTR